MPPHIPLEEGMKLVKTARKTIENAFEGETERERGLLEKRGVFVTLETFPEKNLRGCIGFPYPVKPLDEAVCEAALESAFGDPRFPPLVRNELEKITVEVSVLTVPEPIHATSPQEIEKKIVVGRDGLIIEYGSNRGLLLPIVPVEWNWSVREFLNALCNKAGLPTGFWAKPEARVYSFESQVFKEKTPGGKVEEIDLAAEAKAKKL